jgi:hypothetical protein
MYVIATSCSDKVKKYSSNYLPAVTTETADQNVFKIGLKGILFGQLLFDIQKQVFSTIQGFSAFAADQMMVMSLFGMMVDKMISRFTFNDTTGAFQ